jgi:hypothetical protein
MHTGTIAFALLTIATLTPAAADATPERMSVKACARAFAGSIAAPGAAAPAYKLAYRGSTGSMLSDYYPTEYTFTLEARNPKSGAAIARAVCSVNSKGIVTSIAALPLNAKPEPYSAGL